MFEHSYDLTKEPLNEEEQLALNRETLLSVVYIPVLEQCDLLRSLIQSLRDSIGCAYCDSEGR